MPESQAPAETLETTSPETGDPKSELDQIVDALTDEPEEQTPDSGSEAKPETADKKANPKNLSDLAERLGVEVKDLYALEIPFDVGGDDGGEVEYKSLGEIKDAFRASDSITTDRLAWEETKASQEQKLARATTELQELVALLPQNAIKPELLERVARSRAEAYQREQQLTRAAIPDWKSEGIEESDRAEMTEYLGRYGFPSNYLDNVVDHKTVVFIRDATKRAMRIEKALEDVQTLRKAGHRPSAKPSTTPKRKATTTRVRRDTSEVDQVVELLSKVG